jgi:hypothetical protein
MGPVVSRIEGLLRYSNRTLQVAEVSLDLLFVPLVPPSYWLPFPLKTHISPLSHDASGTFSPYFLSPVAPPEKRAFKAGCMLKLL